MLNNYNSFIFISILATIAGCTANPEQFTDNLGSELQICQNYLDNYDLLYSSQIAALSNGKKQSLINITYEINVRGLSKEFCQELANEASY